MTCSQIMCLPHYVSSMKISFIVHYFGFQHPSIIADVANSKRHQQLDEILIIFTRTIQEISEVVCKKTMSETHAFITNLCCIKRAHYSKRMMCKQDCVKFHGCIA